MEDAMKGPVSDQQPEPIDTDSGVYSRRPEIPASSSQSAAGNPDLGSSLDPASTMADENLQASEIGVLSPEGKCESTMHFLV